MKKIFVINAKGEKEPFSFTKVYKSAKRAGASKEIAFEIAKEIEKEAYPQISTFQIYQKIIRLLSKRDFKTRIRFALKEAIRKLGPSGFPFEKFVGEIFKSQGYEVEYNLSLVGSCNVIYEIDFLALNRKEVFIGECKFHDDPSKNVDLKVALANYARFLDLRDCKYLKKFSGLKIYPILVTNAKFTNQAIKYSECVGQKLLGWKYPKGHGLEKIIEENKLYPITILPSVSKGMVAKFTQIKIMLVKDIFKYSLKELEKMLGLPTKYLKRILFEAEMIV